jgi:subtilisin-like proprotein convertase family protein
MRKTTLFAAIVLLAAPASAGLRQIQYDRMLQLAGQMRELRQQGQGGTAAFLAAYNEYQALSASFGGGDPGATLGDTSPSHEAPAAPHVVPPVPPNCPAVATTTAANNTPVPIPDNPGAVATSTIVIAGAGAFLFDLELTMSITHLFPDDLDMTLTSPSGTIVTISTDNATSGTGMPGVFNGTVFDDQADPDGQVPYATNAGLVNDHPYAANVLASPLVPEEAFAAFKGEDPNGTWTLTIDDDFTADAGTLNSWSLSIATIPAPPVFTPTVVFSNNTPVPIPDNPGAVATSTVVVAGVPTSLWTVQLTTAITHTFPADLDFTLTSPAGTVVSLSTDNGGTNDDVHNGTVWDIDADPDGQVPYTTNAGLVTDHLYANLTLATPLVPEESFAAFQGQDPNGTWTLTFDDDLAAFTGTLNSWSISFVTAACDAPCLLTCPSNVTQSNDPDLCTAIVNFPPPETTGDCGPIVCSPVSGSIFPVGTTTVTCLEQQSGQQGPLTCDFTVTVNDTQPPQITPPAPVQVGTDAPACEATATYPPPVASDNCPGVGAVCVPASGSIFPLGSTTVTCTATDASGNTASGPTAVTVVDDDAPVLTCPPDIVDDLPPGVPSGPVTWSDPLVADNCPNPGSPTCVPPSGSIFTGGQTVPVDCSATDAAGNPGTCSFNVTLNLVSILEIPTASTWGLAALALLLAGAAFVALRRNG